MPFKPNLRIISLLCLLIGIFKESIFFKKKINSFFYLFIFLLFSPTLQAQIPIHLEKEHGKLDLSLRYPLHVYRMNKSSKTFNVEVKNQLNPALNGLIYKYESEGILPEIEVIVKANKSFNWKKYEKIDAKKINRYDFEKYSYLTGFVPIDYLDILCFDREVLKIEASTLGYSNTTASARSINVDEVWRSGIDELYLKNEITGRNINVAVIEIDRIFASHHSFLDDSGDCRIKKLWDFESSTDETLEAFTCSNYPFLTAIDNSFSHATHVTSIAAGSAFNNDINLRGVAFNSDILFGRISTLNQLLKVIEEMIVEVDNEPLVINLSFAFYGGSRDGKTLHEECLNKLILNHSNVNIVVAAGNNANTNFIEGFPHWEGTIDNEQESVELFFIDRNIQLSAGDAIYIDIYSSSELNVEVFNDNRLYRDQSSGIISSQERKELIIDEIWRKGKITITNFSDNEVEGTHNIRLKISDYSTNTNLLFKNQLRIKLSATEIHEQIRIDAYHSLFDNSFDMGFGGFKKGEGSNSQQSMLRPATAEQVITVGSFDYVDSKLSNYSSQGPLRNEPLSHSSKPDLTAPGNSEYKLSKNLGIPAAGITSVSGTLSEAGTSQAAPHVAGAIALILENFPNLTNLEIKKLLKETAAKPYANAPAYQWGSGKLDVLAAYQTLVGYRESSEISTASNPFKEVYANTDYKGKIGLPFGPVQSNWESSIHEVQHVANGVLFNNTRLNEIFWINQPIWDKWKEVREASSEFDIGFPTSSMYQNEEGKWAVSFEKCTLTWNEETSEVLVHCCTNDTDGSNLTYVPNAGTLEVDGSEITLTNVTILNNGNCNAGGFQVGFYLSNNETFTTEDYLIHQVGFSNLEVNQSEQISFAVDITAIPFEMPPNGAYFVGLLIDPNQSVSEINEEDNRGHWQTPRVNIQNTSITCADAIPIYCGDTVSASTIGKSNIVEDYSCTSLDMSGSEVIFEFVKTEFGDFTATLGNLTADLEILILNACDEIECVKYGDETVTIVDAPAGIYYIVIDGYREAEGSFDLTISCETGAPNLVFGQTNVIEVDGTTVVAEVTVKNIGCGSMAGTSTLMAFLTVDYQYDDLIEDHLVGYFDVPALAPDEAYKVQINFDAANIGALDESIYFLGYIIDFYRSVSESSEIDNEFIWYDVDHQVNIRSSRPNIALYQGPNNSLTISNSTFVEQTIGIINLGATNTGAFKIGFYLSDDLSYEHKAFSLPIDNLSPDEIKTVSISYDANTLNLAAGFYFIQFYFDYEDSVAEANEDDNAWFYSTGNAQVIISNSPSCGETVVLRDSKGSFSDNSGSEDYQDNTKCQWLIAPSEGNKTITLYFPELNTEASYDEITIYDGNSAEDPILAEISGSSSTEAIQSTGSNVLVRFSTDNTTTDKGFYAEYFTNDVSFCGGFNELLQKKGVITDGSACSNYQHNASCSWLIQSENDFSVVQLTFEEFALHTSDVVKIYQGINENGNLLYSFSGNHLPESIAISGSVYIAFESDDHSNDEGFTIIYEVLEAAPSNIAGMITSVKQQPIEGVSVRLSAEQLQVTATNGTYFFENITPLSNHLVTPSKEGDWREAIDISDLLILDRHIIGTDLISDPYQLIAADLDRSGIVNDIDRSILMAIIHGNTSLIPESSPWVFIPQSYEFSNPLNPWMEEFPESIIFNKIQGSYLNENFYGIKLGDLSTSQFGIIEESNDENKQVKIAISSATKEVELQQFVVSSRPNPFQQSTEVSFTIPDAGEVEFMVVNAVGQTVFYNKNFYTQGLYKLQLDAEICKEEGVYTLHVIGEYGIRSLKIIKIK